MLARGGAGPWRVDYRPVALIEHALELGQPASRARQPLTELLRAALPPLDAAAARDAPCPASYPTAAIAAALGLPMDGHDDNSHVALRLDFAFANTHYTRSANASGGGGVRCTLSGAHFHHDGTVGEDDGHAAALRDAIAASDHLPLLCVV